jgi:bacterioferritin
MGVLGRSLAILTIAAMLASGVRWGAVRAGGEVCACPPTACRCPGHHHALGHAAMCENWGYKTLAATTTKRSIDEMKHAEKLITHMLFLEGAPDVQKMPKVHIGKNVEEQFAKNLEDELAAIASYNQAIAICTKAGDNVSGELLRGILQDEERHADYLETQLSLIKQLGLANYLAQNLAA